MSRLGFKNSKVYHGEAFLGELDVAPVDVSGTVNFGFPNNEIRIHHLSPPSERCSPLSILQTIASFQVRCKLESSVPTEQHHLINLHAACFHELKTAVVLLGDEEVHMVAMPSRQKKFPCFWCYAAPKGLYAASVGMLNPRCLSIVFDLDETLIVANSLKSFEDKIELLRCHVSRETDPLRLTGMSGEMKRYMDDRAMLKQYSDNDVIVDNGNVFKAQMEEIPLLSNGQEKVFRPVIRVPEKNLVLTRINPEIRDTSVLVRMRPAWEDLRSYLNAKGRKRFEVYVCTMAERDYALEMWRLLDPEAHLIDLKQLPDRVFCVKSGSKKSLLNVFQYGTCHPKMAMVIDDRLKVWEDKDQPRVHVVPPFTPYYAPQAETAHPLPILCVARNVACNVRGWFYREFDENFMRKVSEISYEDELGNLPQAPDVSSYMVSEDAGFVPNGSHTSMAEGMSGAEAERRIYHDVKKFVDSASQSINTNFEPRSEVSHPTGPVLPNASGLTPSGSLLPSQRPGLLGAPIRRDVRSQTSSDPPLLPRFPAPISALSAVQPQGGWLVEGGINKGNTNIRPLAFPQDHDPVRYDKQWGNQNSFNHSTGLFPGVSQKKAEEPYVGPQGQKSAASISEAGVSHNQPFSNSRELQNGAGKASPNTSSLYIDVLQEIGRKCCSKVDFNSVTSTSKDLQFTVEVLFTGEKIGVGVGKTRKDAQQAAAENALHTLAERYLGHIAPTAGAVDRDVDKLSPRNENGFLWDVVHSGNNEAPQEDGLAKEGTSERTEVMLESVNTCAANPQVPRHAGSQGM